MPSRHVFEFVQVRILRLACGALATLALIGNAIDTHAEQMAVELILAIDCSSSVLPVEYALQMQGVADAFHSTEVIQAITSATPNGVAVTFA